MGNMNMPKLTRQELFPLEKYAEIRPDFRLKVMQHKKNRQVTIGEHARLYFEDKLTVQYQVQEMLRAECIYEPAGIEEELQAYTPLIPDGDNWKATFMLEYDNIDERRIALTQMIGIENKIWIRAGFCARVFAIADEDLERANADKTSAVHFVRFGLTPEMIKAVKSGAEIVVGIEHGAYKFEVNPIPRAVRDSLAQDLIA